MWYYDTLDPYDEKCERQCNTANLLMSVKGETEFPDWANNWYPRGIQCCADNVGLAYAWNLYLCAEFGPCYYFIL